MDLSAARPVTKLSLRRLEPCAWLPQQANDPDTSFLMMTMAYPIRGGDSALGQSVVGSSQESLSAASLVTRCTTLRLDVTSWPHSVFGVLR
jgi:hypothetical protein